MLFSACRFRFPATALLAALLAGSPRIPAQTQVPLHPTIEWMCSPEAAEIATTPTVHWLADGRAVLFDTLRPPADRTLEILDPASGKRAPLTDPATVLGNMKTALGENTAPRSLPGPMEIDANGATALFLFDGDVVLLDIPSRAVLRITHTPEHESCAHFSPDGNAVAYVRGNNLFVFDRRSGMERQLTFDGSDSLKNGTLSWVYWEEIFGRFDVGYWWSPDSRSIAFLRTDESGVSTQHYVDVKPWTPRLISQRYPKVGEKNPSVRLGVVQVQQGKTTWMDLTSFPYEYIVRVQWLPDGSLLSLQTMNRLQTEKDLLVAQPATGQVHSILRETDSAWVNIDDDLIFLHDGRHFIWSSERDGFKHLYLYTLEGTLVNQITKGPWATSSAAGGVAWVQRSIVAVDEPHGLLYFTAQEKSSLERHLYRIRIDGSRMSRLSQLPGTHNVSFSPDCRFYFDRYSSVSSPPGLTLHRANGDSLLTLAPPHTGPLAARGIQFPKIFSIPARDGFRLPAQILTPRNFDAAKRYPVIFYVYGGPSAPQVLDTWQRDALWENVLADNGYVVARVDPRSSTGISKNLENLVLHRMMADVELNDLVDAARWMKHQPFVDSSRIGIWGWSGGGSYTLLGMTRSTEFTAGIDVAGVSDFRFYDTKWGEAAMKTESENREGFESVSLLKYAKNLHGYLLIIHGTYDDNVHIQNTWAFIDELITARTLFELMIYPMRMHGISDMSARIHLYSTMLDFWKRRL
jgi:dipeptidyl-peptidase-4